MTSVQSIMMKARWADPEFRARVLAGRRGRSAKKSRARFSAHVSTSDIVVRPLAPHHPAVVEGRSMFKGARVPALGEHVLISAMNQRKIGHRIVKGAWAGLPVYTVSLEERAACPRSCHMWTSCYGNAMPFAKRWKPGPDFARALFADLFFLAGRHKRGFAVRVHVLGDFYSRDYVELWATALEAIPGLHVWGYTAHREDSAIGAAVQDLNADFQRRCVIRFSAQVAGAMRAVVVKAKVDAGPAIVCPAETGAAANCGSCGLCWADAARKKTIAFLLHGNPGRGPAREKAAA